MVVDMNHYVIELWVQMIPLSSVRVPLFKFLMLQLIFNVLEKNWQKKKKEYWSVFGLSRRFCL